MAAARAADFGRRAKSFWQARPHALQRALCGERGLALRLCIFYLPPKLTRPGRMVTFTCGACGESLKKNKVEQHYMKQCRSCEVVSCIDCGKDFPGDSYMQHTSCISEAQKYQGHLYKEKPGQNKGELKQQAWLDVVRAATSKASPRLQSALAQACFTFISYLLNSLPSISSKLSPMCQENRPSSSTLPATASDCTTRSCSMNCGRFLTP